MIGKTNAISGVSAPVPIIKTVSGSVISISDALAMPAESLIAYINPVQSGSGDPSPSNVRPISGWSAVKVMRAGKNLYDKTTATDGKFINASGQEIASGNYGHSAPIKVKPNTKYCMTGYAGAGYYAMLGLDGNMNTLPTWYGGASKTDPFVATTPSNCAYIILNYLLAQKDSIAFYESDTVGEFIPYQGNTYTIQLGQTVYGGSLDVTTGVLTVDKGYILLAGGSEATYVKNGATANTSRGIVTIPNKANGVSNIVSNRFSAAITGDTVGRMYGIASNNNVEFYLPVSVPQTDADVKSWFSSNNTQLVYELATPQTVQLTPTQVQMLLGNNVLWADSGDSELQYWARR